MHGERAVLSCAARGPTAVLDWGLVQGGAVAATGDLRARAERDVLRRRQRRPIESWVWCEAEVVDAGTEAHPGVASVPKEGWQAACCV